MKATFFYICGLCILLSGNVWALSSADTYHATGTASYYTVASCAREGTSGIMANGRRLNDEKLTAASWFYPF